MFGEETNFDIIPGPNHGVNLFFNASRVIYKNFHTFERKEIF